MADPLSPACMHGFHECMNVLTNTELIYRAMFFILLLLFENFGMESDQTVIILVDFGVESDQMVIIPCVPF